MLPNDLVHTFDELFAIECSKFNEQVQHAMSAGLQGAINRGLGNSSIAITNITSPAIKSIQPRVQMALRLILRCFESRRLTMTASAKADVYQMLQTRLSTQCAELRTMILSTGVFSLTRLGQDQEQYLSGIQTEAIRELRWLSAELDLAISPDSATTEGNDHVRPPCLDVLTDKGLIPLMDAHPPFVHLEAIKTSAAILRTALDEIEQITERHRHPVPAAGTDPIWIYECKKLDRYHDMRIALQREVQRYLPEVEIPILSDFTKAWRWNSPMPDKKQFVTELQKIEHQANLRQVKQREADELSSKQSRWVRQAARGLNAVLSHPVVSAVIAAMALPRS